MAQEREDRMGRHYTHGDLQQTIPASGEYEPLNTHSAQWHIEDGDGAPIRLMLA